MTSAVASTPIKVELIEECSFIKETEGECSLIKDADDGKEKEKEVKQPGTPTSRGKSKATRPGKITNRIKHVS